MAKRMWCYGTENTQKFTWWNDEIQWWNGVTIKTFISLWWKCNKYGEMVQRIHTSSPGEMAKHSSGDILFEKWRHGEMVILTFVKTIIHSNRCCIYRLCISRLWALLHWSSYTPMVHSNTLWCRISLLFLVDTFLFYLPFATANTGGVGGGVVPFCNILILSIAPCYYNNNILYYLCTTVKYTTFNSAVWSCITNFQRSTLEPCRILTRPTKILGSKIWMYYHITNLELIRLKKFT